jgi:hypothetical protein
MEIEISEQLHNEILFFFLELEKKSGYVDNWEANPVFSGGSKYGLNYSLEEARIENERRSKLPKKVLKFRYFSDYKSKMLEFEKDLTTRGYSNFSFSKKFLLAYPDTNFVSLSISIYSNEGHFSQKFQVSNFQFVEVGGDGTYWKEFSGAGLYLLSQDYNYSENQEGQRLKNKIEQLLSKPYEDSQKSNKSSNNNHSNQVRKAFNLMDFLIQYWWIILIVGLAVYGFIVQHND